MLQTFDFPAGGRQINARANFIRYRSASAGGADDTIKLRADGQDLGVFSPGDWMQLPIEATQWEVVPLVATVTGKLTLGMGRAGSDNLSAVVEVADRAWRVTQAGKQFICSVSLGASAGQNAYVGLYNNGPSFAVKRLVVQSATAGPVWVAKSAGTGTALVAPTNDIPNKRAAGAVATVRRASGYGAGVLPTVAEVPGYVEFGRVYVPANTPVEYPLSTPLLFDSNSSVLVNCGTINRDVSAIFDFEEL